MSGVGGDERDEHPGVPAPRRQPPLYRVMIACGIAGVLIAIGAAAVDFGTGRHPKLPDVPGVPSAPGEPGGSDGSGLPSLPSFPSGPGLPSGFPSFPVPTR